MSGYKDFVAGDPLTAAQVDGYLMRQSVMVFDTTAARDSALSGVLVEGMTCYIKDITGNGTAGTCVYNGAGWFVTFSEWETFTPAFTNLTVGNGTLVAKYQYSGNKVDWFISLTWGSTTAITGSFVYCTYPVTAADTYQAGTNANAFYTIGLSHYPGSIRPKDTAEFYLSIVAASGTYAKANHITATVPATWTTGHIMGIAGTIAI